MTSDTTPAPPSGVDPTIPSIARVYDYLLGGKDNFAADRVLAEKILKIAPNARETAQANRRFLVRATRYVAKEGIRQFLDLGTGLPTSPNVHEVAHKVSPDARVGYVDNDPIVLVHARALLRDAKNGVIAVPGDLREPKTILDDRVLLDHIDFTQPVAVLVVAMLHLLKDEDGPHELLAAIRERIAPGSYLVMSHLWDDPDGIARASAEEYARSGASASVVPRSEEQIERFLEGFELVEPGLVFLDQWRPDEDVPLVEADNRVVLCAVGRKP